MDWLEEAKQLAPGMSTKIPCCKGDNTFSITNANKGFIGYCFRCGRKEFSSHGDFSLSDIKVRRRARDLYTKDVKLPLDYTKDVPDSHSIWYLQYGISLEQARRNNIGYSKYYDRVILPVYNGDKLVVMQARSIKGSPKYINSGNSDGVIFKTNKVYEPDVVVVTEDILSAIKVTSLHVQGVSTLGTSGSILDAQAIKAIGADKVVIWYDKDSAGKKGRLKLYKRLSMLGITPYFIETDKDPKEYNSYEISYYIDTTINK